MHFHFNHWQCLLCDKDSESIAEKMLYSVLMETKVAIEIDFDNRSLDIQIITRAAINNIIRHI